jgi:hypothetical protein
MFIEPGVPKELLSSYQRSGTFGNNLLASLGRETTGFSRVEFPFPPNPAALTFRRETIGFKSVVSWQGWVKYIIARYSLSLDNTLRSSYLRSAHSALLWNWL